MKKYLIISFIALAVLAGCKKQEGENPSRSAAGIANYSEDLWNNTVFRAVEMADSYVLLDSIMTKEGSIADSVLLGRIFTYTGGQSFHTPGAEWVIRKGVHYKYTCIAPEKWDFTVSDNSLFSLTCTGTLERKISQDSCWYELSGTVWERVEGDRRASGAVEDGIKLCPTVLEGREGYHIGKVTGSTNPYPEYNIGYFQCFRSGKASLEIYSGSQKLDWCKVSYNNFLPRTMFEQAGGIAIYETSQGDYLEDYTEWRPTGPMIE